MGDRVHRLIVCVDIEKFSGAHRTDEHRNAAHEGMYRALDEALRGCGVVLPECHHEDRGDGALVLIPPDVPKAGVLAALPGALAAELAEHNHVHAHGAQVRLRVGVHAGEVKHNGFGVVGEAVNTVYRLLDAGELKQALSGSKGLVAVIASDRVFQEVIRHTPASVPDTWRKARIKVKETRATAWIRLPDHWPDRDEHGRPAATNTGSQPDAPHAEDDLDDLIPKGSATIVGAFATDAYKAAREGFARLFGQLGAAEATRAKARMDDDQELVRNEEASERERARRALAPAWELRLVRLLRDRPEALPELRDLLAELEPALPDEGRHWIMNVVARGHGTTAYGAQGGNVVHYDLSRGNRLPPAPGERR
jgi:class 3 adenylate cyclase